MLFLTIILGLGWALAEVQYNMDQAEVYFENFIQKYNRSYVNDEEKQMRYNIFRENLQEIINSNLRHGYNVMGINRFSDMSKEEFKSKYLGLKPDEMNLGSYCSRDKDFGKLEAPESFDWRDQGVVTPVKNQGCCGSCWAFSTIANVESQYAIKHKKQLDLSEQQEVDCDNTNYGCDGGDTPQALLNLIKVGGLMSEADYPYKAIDGSCKFDAKKVQVKVTGCFDFSGANEEHIKGLLVKYGPLTIALGASTMAHYQGSVLKECDPQINHALLLVGYGTDEKTKDPYWIIKNSWGLDWGEQGYLRLIRGNPKCKLGSTSLTTSVVA